MSAMTVAALAAILVTATFLRLRDLHLAEGSLGIDEARLTLVARGIAEHGWPLLPSGKVYTRGLVSSFMMAPSLIVLGPSDFAACLPSAISGVLLVLVAFLYGRGLGGDGAGLLAAALAASYPPLIAWSRQAWMYSTLTLLWVLALYLFDRAVARGSGRALLLGGCALGLGLLTHELTALLLPAIGLWLVVWVRDGTDRGQRLRFALGAVAPIAVALALLLAFALALRSDTLAGSTSEFRDFIAPKLDAARVGFYFSGELIADRRWILVAVAVAGLAVADRALRGRLLLPLIGVLPLLLAVVLVIPVPQHRYVLPLMAILMVVAATGAATLVGYLRRRLPDPAGIVAGIVVCSLVLVTVPPPADLLRRSEARGASWITELYALGYRPGDLVLTDTTTIAWHYLGRTDGWLRSRNYEKYATEQWDGIPRDIHTRAPVVRTTRDFEQLVRDPNRGRVAWVIGSGRRENWRDLVDPRLRERLADDATLRKQTADGRQIYRLRL